MEEKTVKEKIILNVVIPTIIFFCSLLFIFFNSDILKKGSDREKLFDNYQVIPVSLIKEDWTETKSTGFVMSTTVKNKKFSVICSNGIHTSPEDGYVSLKDPFGSIIYIDSTWYIANIAIPFASKEKVLNHILSCSNELEQKIINTDMSQKENIQSWK